MSPAKPGTWSGRTKREKTSRNKIQVDPEGIDMEISLEALGFVDVDEFYDGASSSTPLPHNSPPPKKKKRKRKKGKGCCRSE
ncbi:hypothetical protein RUM44_008114 [Polyplax serrata]|uniref:Uncharacterized protein n=1 Tax=Polyplax serrata TaxID=468196 RepID=A0ABR1B7S4_POLSC